MATSEVSICNQALALLGQSTILSLSDASNAAKQCNLVYDVLRDSVLRAFPWNFSITRQSLARNATAPSFGYLYSYNLPSDPFCLRVLDTDEDVGTIEWKVEGRKILTDEPSLSIRYISRVLDTSLYDPLFTTTLAHRIASEIAFSITKIEKIAELQYNLYLAKLDEAHQIDSQEGTSQRADANALLNVR